MSATFSGVKRKVIYKRGLNNTWIQIPKFWAGYVSALTGSFPEEVNIDMDENGVLTITPERDNPIALTGTASKKIDMGEDGILTITPEYASKEVKYGNGANTEGHRPV